MQIQNELSSPKECAARIYDLCGHVIDPGLAKDLW